MRVSEVMTVNVITATPATSLEAAAQLMIRHHISGLPVVDAAEGLVGLLTEGDLLRRVEIGTERVIPRWRTWLLGPGRLAGEYVHAHAHKVGELMTRSVITVAPGSSLSEVVALMEARGIKRLPVVVEGRLVGIVSRADLLRALQRLQPPANAAPIADAELRRRLLQEIAAQPWTSRASIDASVDNGMVELRGMITHPQERAALRVLAENVPGVRGVVDQTILMEPYTGTLAEVPSTSP